MNIGSYDSRNCHILTKTASQLYSNYMDNMTTGRAMATTSMNVSLPDGLKEYVKERVAEGTYSTPSDFVRDLIRADMQRRGRQKLEQMLLEGIASGEAEEVTPEYLATLRSEAESIIAGGGKPAV